MSYAPPAQRARRVLGPVPRALAAALALALLLTGCGRRFGGGDTDTTPLSDSCGSADNPLPRAAPARKDSRERVTDDQAHLSYLVMDVPWKPVREVSSPGHLGALFAGGFQMVTDSGTPNGDYLGLVVSGRVYPGQVQHPDLQCVAEKMAEDLRSSYYPQPNQRTDLAGKAVNVGGSPGYLLRFRLSYNVSGYTAKSELVNLEVIDTGRADLSVMYTSIPDNIRQYEADADQVVASVQPA